MLNFLLIILLGISDCAHGDDTKRAKPGEFNYFVMIWHRNQFQCGGIIINQRNILTRATCVTGIPSSALSIIAGSVDTQKFKSQPSQVESVHIHYGFKAVYNLEISDEIHWLHDIAVLKLVNPMVWDALTKPAVLITEGYYLNEDFGFVVPIWKHTYIGKPKERVYVRWKKAIRPTYRDCIKSGVVLLENEKCAHWSTTYPGGGVLCDRSSPFINGNTVIGLVDGRKRGKYQVFLSLLPYKDFIADAIDDQKYDTNPGDANYVVSIWDQGNFKCGGIILTALHILTTGYCVQYANQTDLQVIAGYTQVPENAPLIQRLSINNIELHPGYEEIIHMDGPKSMTIKNNNAILTLAVPLEWGSTIGPVPLPNEYSVPTNQICRAFRWHYAYIVDDEVLLQLVWSREFIMDREVCQKAGIDLEADEICVNSEYAQHRNGLESSGNPVVCEGYTIGMIIPDFSTAPCFSCLTTVLGLSPLINSMENTCYGHPT